MGGLCRLFLIVEFTVKNIILYDALQNVSGFVEFKIRADRTDIKVRYNSFAEEGLLLSVVAEGEYSYVFSLAGDQSLFELKCRLEPAKEIFVCVIKKEGQEIRTLASGILNQDRKNLKKRAMNAKEIREEIDEIGRGEYYIEKDNGVRQLIAEPVKTEEAQEVDEVLRKVCTIGDDGKGQCESCPYREHFYTFTLEHQSQGQAVGQESVSVGKQILVE